MHDTCHPPKNSTIQTHKQDEVLVSSDRTGGVTYILLNRPKALNAFNVHMVKNIKKEMKVSDNNFIELVQNWYMSALQLSI